jgi:hypothetical protein
MIIVFLGLTEARSRDVLESQIYEDSICGILNLRDEQTDGRANIISLRQQAEVVF